MHIVKQEKEEELKLKEENNERGGIEVERRE